jgi:hypothetical protein
LCDLAAIYEVILNAKTLKDFLTGAPIPKSTHNSVANASMKTNI